MTKNPYAGLVFGVVVGALLATAAILAAREQPVPLRQVESRYGQNIDIPGNSTEPVFYMTMSIDGYSSTFSCVRHNDTMPHAPGVAPR
jgi:hypothetical protein